MLGHCYRYGIGTNIDKQKAVELYQKAANLGNCTAQYNLAFMYENGEGIIRDIDQAIYWFKRSAEGENQGFQNALDKLETLKFFFSF